MYTSIPIVRGVSALQRSYKSVIKDAKDSNQPVFLSDRWNISVVLLSKSAFENLVSKKSNMVKDVDEDNYWLAASTKSLDFWDNEDDEIWDTI